VLVIYASKMQLSLFFRPGDLVRVGTSTQYCVDAYGDVDDGREYDDVADSWTGPKSEFNQSGSTNRGEPPPDSRAVLSTRGSTDLKHRARVQGTLGSRSDPLF